ncbi:Protein of unknown function [Cotesia congregata]|uniref:Uncharacterized protein n=1 Tax=Cotesia congregata TaxID=51543 RepID=A0A8J2MHL8_COTCN|nr:Protein of unknown function [Cotesia congregata]
MTHSKVKVQEFTKLCYSYSLISWIFSLTYNLQKRLLEFCFSDRLNPVVTTEDLYDKIHKIPWEIVEPPIIILDRNVISKEIQVFNPRYPTYVLSVSGSIQNLKTLFDKLKSTTMWSVESYFFIVEVKNFCENADEVLKLLWKIDLLSSFYLCRKSDSGDLIIYNYNPFTNYAPYPWRSAETTSQEIAEKGTLFYQHFDNDRRVCHNITFDKTKNLRNHQIKTLYPLAVPKATRDNVIDVRSINLTLIRNPKEPSVDFLFNFLNITPSPYFIHMDAVIDASKKGYLKALASGNYDINERNMPIASTNYEYTDILTYYKEIKFSIITQKRTFLAIINQIVSEHNYEIILFSIIVILSVAIPILIHNYFAFAIQNEISALLAGPSHYTIDTLQNLFDYRYHVFYDQELHQDILNKNIWVTNDDKKFLHSCGYEKLFDCSKNVRENSTIACIYLTKLQLPYVKRLSNLYVSKIPVFTKYYAPWTRKNWALKKKFDKLGQRVFDSWFINYEDRKIIINRLKKIRKKERIEASEQIDEVTENDLIPAYKFFGVSLIIALLIFCVEVIIEKMSTHSKTDHKQTMTRVEPKIERSKRRKTIKKYKRNRNRRS